MAAALFARHVGAAVIVGSAGFLAAGHQASEAAMAAAARYGVDLAGHRSAVVDRPLLDGADLVVTMERAHLREAAILAPTAFARIFTLRDIVARSRRAPRPTSQPLRAWAEGLGAGRDPGELLGESRGEDIADPIGGPQARFDATADELDGLVATLARCLGL